MRTGFRSFAIGPVITASAYSSSSSPCRSSRIAACAASAAAMPDSMALWLPLMRGTFRKPAESPISAPPGKVSFGIDCQPPSEMARAP